MKQFVVQLKKWGNAYLPPVLWGVLIFILSSQQTLPGFDESLWDFVFKKLAHITVYAVLYLLLFRAVQLTINTQKNFRYLTIPLAICLVYAVTDEFHQSLVPGRYPTFRDVGYDMLGASVALLKTSNCI